jgi:lysine/ornithine N-monooxygenase
MKGGRPTLLLKDAQGNQRSVEADHVIAATGYRVDIERLQFLSSAVREKIRTTGNAPALSGSYESSVPRLYFVGVSSANSFGPMMRFAFGADYTARRISKRLVKPIRAAKKVYAGSESARAPEHV